MKKALWILIPLLVIGGGIGGWTYWQRNTKANVAPPPTDTVKRGDLQLSVSANGTVASNMDVDIKCRASGEIVEFPYDVSNVVKPGALLMRLDTKDEQPPLAQAIAQIAVDNAHVEQAQVNLKIAQDNLTTTTERVNATLASCQIKLADARAKEQRTQELFDQHLDSKEDLETAHTTAVVAQADLETAQVAVAELDQQKAALDSKRQDLLSAQAQLVQDQSRKDLAQQEVNYCKVYAPDADNPNDPPYWIVSSIGTNVAKGYLVQSGTGGSSGGTTVMTLSDISHLFVLAAVNEADIGAVQDRFARGQVLPVTITADAYGDYERNPNHVFQGKVIRIGKATVTSNVTTFEVKIEVTSPNRFILRPNMTATCQIILAEKKDVLLVSTQAVTAKSNGKRGHNGETLPTTADTTSAAAPAKAHMILANAEADPPAPATAPAATAPATAPLIDFAARNLAAYGRDPDRPSHATVTLLKPDGSTEVRNVEVGLSDGPTVEVVSGLNEGDTVLLNRGGGDSRWRNNNNQARMLMGGRH